MKKITIKSYHSLPTYKGDDWLIELLPNVYALSFDKWSDSRVLCIGISWLGVGVEVRVTKRL